MKGTLPNVTASALFLFLWWISPLQAQWVEDGTVICSEAFDQVSPSIISDGAGGTIMTWQDERNGSDFNIYAQRADAAGRILWISGGIAICAESGDQTDPQLCSDGVGGAVIIWADNRGSDTDIYMQRIDSSGNVLWSVGGNALCTAADIQRAPSIISDGSGGVIVSWIDYRALVIHPDIYAQRVDAEGNVSWAPASGVPICTNTYEQVGGQLSTDGAGGAIITWRDARGVGVRHPYAQRINASGVVQWTTDGISICNASGGQYGIQNISDDSGGAIITWQDLRAGNYDIYAQRVDGLGAFLWATNGVALVTGAGNQGSPVITSDGSGGAIVSWRDDVNGSDYDLYAHRITAAGTPTWTPGGVPICMETGDQHHHQIISDGTGGAIITWQDSRSGLDYDIYAQRYDADGTPLCAINGVAISAEADNQEKPQLVLDSSGEAVFIWQDERSTDFDIYAWRQYFYGPIISTVEDVPNDQGRQVSLTWASSLHDTLGSSIPILEYAVFRLVDPDLSFLKGPNQAPVPPYPEGDWHYLLSVPADCEETYSVVVPTLADSTIAAGMYYTTFFVRARTGLPGEYFDSTPISGYSVDNLAPTVPTGLRQGTGNLLVWDDPVDDDFQYFTVYGSDVDHLDGSEVLIGYTTGTSYDVAGLSYSYFMVAARDFAGNESPAATLDALADIPGVQPTRLALHQCVPNPFNPSTMIRFDLPQAATADLRIYDVSGRLVRVLVDSEPTEAGRREVVWDGRDSAGRQAPSGAYFYRLHAGEYVETKRMTLLK